VALIGAVVIGRNEGQRLDVCLRSVGQQIEEIIYVDSGSTDGSVGLASKLGATLVELSTDQPFTAARARNAGANKLLEQNPGVELIQFIDGDCELQPGWVETASAFLSNFAEIAVVCGRRRERHPNVSPRPQPAAAIRWSERTPSRPSEAFRRT